MNDHRYYFATKQTVAPDNIQVKFAFEKFKKHGYRPKALKLHMHSLPSSLTEAFSALLRFVSGKDRNRRVAEIQIFEKTYLIVIKDETGFKLKINDSTSFLSGSYAQNLVALYKKNGEITQWLQKTEK